jgi:hypothetical protein
MRAGRRTQVVKGAVCKTAMQRFDPARRLQTEFMRLHVYVNRGDFSKLSVSRVLSGPAAASSMK